MNPFVHQDPTQEGAHGRVREGGQDSGNTIRPRCVTGGKLLGRVRPWRSRHSADRVRSISNPIRSDVHAARTHAVEVRTVIAAQVAGEFWVQSQGRARGGCRRSDRQDAAGGLRRPRCFGASRSRCDTERPRRGGISRINPGAPFGRDGVRLEVRLPEND